MERTLEDFIGAHFWSSKRRAREEARLCQQRFLLGLSVVLNMLNLWTSMCLILFMLNFLVSHPWTCLSRGTISPAALIHGAPLMEIDRAVHCENFPWWDGSSTRLYKSCSKCLIYNLDSKMACFGSPKHFFSFCIQTFLCPVQQQHEKPNLTRLAPHDGRRWRQQNLHLPTIAQRRASMDLLNLPCMRYAC